MSADDGIRMAICTKDIDALWIALENANKSQRGQVLAQILQDDWHESHEDIVFELGILGEPVAIDSIAKAAVRTFDYMAEWGNLQEFQRKCAYSLARIGTPYSLSALEILSKHPDEYISKCGKEGMENWSLSHRDNEPIEG